MSLKWLSAFTESKDALSENERNILIKAEDGIDINSESGRLNEEKNANSQTQDAFIPYRYKILAIAMVILAGFTFTGANVLQKKTIPGLDYLTLLFHRACVQTLGLSIYFIVKRKSVLGPNGSRGWLCGQGAIGAVLLISIFIAVRNVPLGSASAIFFCTPVFTYLFSAWLLEDEFFGAFRIIICCLMLSGVILITRPEFMFSDIMNEIESDNTSKNNGTLLSTLYIPYYKLSMGNRSDSKSLDSYLLVAFLVPILSAVVSICTRKCKNVDICLVTFYFGLGSLFTSIAGLAFTGRGPDTFMLTPTQWASTIGVIALGISGNFLYTGAVKFISPTKSNIFRSFEVILNSVLQYYLEGTKFYSTIYGGTVFLISAMILTGFEKEIVTRINKPWFGRNRRI